MRASLIGATTSGILGDWDGPGSAQAIRILPETNTLIGGSDPRRDGYAAAW